MQQLVAERNISEEKGFQSGSFITWQLKEGIF